MFSRHAKTFLYTGLFTGSILASAVTTAATADDSFLVQVVIDKACTVTASNNVSFGTLSTNTTGTIDGNSTDISVDCGVAGENFTLAINLGANGSGAQRNMTDGTDLIAYNLYPDNTYSTPLSTSAVAETTGAGGTYTTTLYSRMVGGDYNSGTYSDTVTAQIVF